MLKEYEKTRIEIDGYTDGTGSTDYNQRLSETRAESVRRYLAAQQVQEARLVARGYGERNPVASNETTEGRQLNRRVEIRLVPLTS